MNKIVFLLLFLLITLSSSFSQENDEYFGINLSLYNFFSNADFKELPGIPNCCPKFSYGFDNNLGLSIFYRSVLPSKILLQFDIRYYQLSSKFKSIEKETFGTNNGVIEGEFSHFLNSEIDILSINPSIAYNFSNINFNLGLGLSYFLNKRYDQWEQITKPIDRGTFIDSLGNDTGSRIRNANSGNLVSSREFAISMVPKISYQLNLNKDNTIFLEPTIGGEINFLDISREMNWKSFNLWAGLSFVIKLDVYNEENFELIPIDSIKPLPIDTFEINNTRNLNITSDFDKAFSPVYINPVDTVISTITTPSNESMKRGKTLIEYDTLVIKKKMTIRRTKFRYDTLGIDNRNEYLSFNIKDKLKNNLEKISMKEIIVNNEFPLHNRIYYDKNQLEINKEFKEDGIKSFPYYKLFDILKERYTISKNRINLNLIESNGELSNDTLRLQLLRNYLTETLKFNYNDININFNASVTNSNNSIIEIESQYLDNVYLHKDSSKVLNSNLIYFSPEINIKEKIISSQLNIYSDSSLIYNGNINLNNKDIEFDLNSIINSIPYQSNYLKFEIISKSKNKQYKFDKIIKFSYHSIEKLSLLSESIDYIYKRTLINFAYNSKELTPSNIELLNILNNQIQENDMVEIVGYTDDIGNNEYNKNLSLLRANEVGKYIRKGNINIIGAGVNYKYQKMDSPESKIYSRCVEVTITKK